uniref:Uncharacterized protein n=1 Tax=Meloidogyne enterolobii TaxID=390850 RepID=A0A6V7TIG7_MELEN|nr:unnamed protein product [Meloidogyne enterolobii]
MNKLQVFGIIFLLISMNTVNAGGDCTDACTKLCKYKNCILGACIGLFVGVLLVIYLTY